MAAMITTTPKKITTIDGNNIKMSQEERQSISSDLVKIMICADAALNAHENLSDLFKNPNVKQHLKRIKESTEAVKGILRRDPRYNLMKAENEYQVLTGAEMYLFLNMIVSFGLSGIQALNENLRLQLTKPEELTRSYELVNKIANDPLHISGVLIRFATSILSRAGKMVEYNDLLEECLTEIGFSHATER